VKLAGCCFDRNVAGVQTKVDTGAIAFGEEHVEDLARRTIAEELAERLFVPLDSVAADQFEKVLRLIARQCGFRKMGIFREEVCRRALDVGEVASASAGDEDLAARLRIVLEEQHPATAPAGDRGAHQAGSTGTQHDGIKFAARRRHLFIVAELPGVAVRA
jgi:hypothetical protein